MKTKASNHRVKASKCRWRDILELQTFFPNYFNMFPVPVFTCLFCKDSSALIKKRRKKKAEPILKFLPVVSNFEEPATVESCLGKQ